MNSKLIFSISLFLLTILILFNGSTLADCVYPDDEKLVTEAHKITCFKDAQFILLQPTLFLKSHRGAAQRLFKRNLEAI